MNRKNLSQYQLSLTTAAEVDPLICKKIGLYQIFVAFFYLLIAVQAFWVVTELTAVPYCEKPSNVSDHCSKSCEVINYDDPHASQTILARFKWICERRGRFLSYHNSELLGAIAGAFLWGTFNRHHGLKRTIIFGLACHLLFDIILVCYPQESVVFIHKFIRGFTETGFRNASETLLLEILPPKHYKIQIILWKASIAICHFSAALFMLRTYDWYNGTIVSLCLSIVLFLLSFALADSPEAYFSRGQVGRSIQEMEKIARINKQSVDGIRKAIEEAWIKSRTRPKSKDSFFGMFHYPRLTRMFLRIQVFITIIAFGVHVTTFYGAPVVTRNVVPGVTVLLSCLIWYFMSNNDYLRKPLICGFILSIFVNFTLLFIEDRAVQFILSHLNHFILDTMMSYLALSVIVLFPMCIRFELFLAKTIFFLVGINIARGVSFLDKAPWLKALFPMVSVIIIAFESVDLVPTLDFPTLLTLRDAEILHKT